MLKDEQDSFYNGGGVSSPLKNGKTFQPESIYKIENFLVIFGVGIKPSSSVLQTFVNLYRG